MGLSPSEGLASHSLLDTIFPLLGGGMLVLSQGCCQASMSSQQAPVHTVGAQGMLSVFLYGSDGTFRSPPGSLHTQ